MVFRGWTELIVPSNPFAFMEATNGSKSSSGFLRRGPVLVHWNSGELMMHGEASGLTKGAGTRKEALPMGGLEVKRLIPSLASKPWYGKD